MEKPSQEHSIPARTGAGDVSTHVAEEEGPAVHGWGSRGAKRGGDEVETRVGPEGSDGPCNGRGGPGSEVHFQADPQGARG